MRRAAAAAASAAMSSPPATPLKALLLHDKDEDEEPLLQGEDASSRSKPRVNPRALPFASSSLAREDKTTAAPIDGVGRAACFFCFVMGVVVEPRGGRLHHMVQ